MVLNFLKPKLTVYFSFALAITAGRYKAPTYAEIASSSVRKMYYGFQEGRRFIVHVGFAAISKP